MNQFRFEEHVGSWEYTLQTIVSREVKPGETAIVTVGYIQVRAKDNIIPDQAELGLTIRAYKPEVRNNPWLPSPALPKPRRRRRAHQVPL